MEILIFAATGNESTGIGWGQPHNMLLCVPVCVCVKQRKAVHTMEEASSHLSGLHWHFPLY